MSHQDFPGFPRILVKPRDLVLCLISIRPLDPA